MSWRFRGRWSLVGQYFNSADTYRAVLEEDIEWGDVVFGAGTNAAVGFDFSVTRIFFGRQLNTSESLPALVKHEFGLSEQYKTPDSLPMNWLN